MMVRPGLGTLALSSFVRSFTMFSYTFAAVSAIGPLDAPTVLPEAAPAAIVLSR